MFEIGPALREARERRGLSLGAVETGTAIRTRYLRALEDEQFSVLPGPTYTKGFLRAYAEYLGLDGQLFIDEFNALHQDPRSGEQPIAPRPRSRPQQRRQRRESNLVMIVLAAIVAVSALVLLALKFPSTPPAAYNTTPPKTTTPPTSGSTGAATQPTTHVSRRLHVVITLSAPTWIRAAVGSATGPGARTSRGTNLGAGGIVDPAVTGSTGITFTARAPLYLFIGNPAVAAVTVNGHAVTLPAGVAAPRPFVLTPGAVRAG
jgi:cytoskeleton protein RodZ